MQNVLITGGCGTLGKAIMTTARRDGWQTKFTLLSRNELLQAQTRAKFPEARYVIGDVRDYDRLNSVVAGHDTIIHAAAMKRIPECEQSPTECYLTNVLGSANVIRAALAHGVERVLGISTDKACRATTAYGASKLMMEKLFRAAPMTRTIFTCVRYGNVMASRGSVLELWAKQAARSLPLTITDPRMTRFFMSPFEAVKLIELGLTLPHGTVAVKKMGSVSVGEMAGMLFHGAETVMVGLRSEEKAHEDLVHVDEDAKTHGADHYIVGSGTTGHAYNSLIAWRLNADELRAMLQDAKALE
jgi:UDP-N-acetylglucosamine 4,6-dehydratase